MGNNESTQVKEPETRVGEEKEGSGDKIQGDKTSSNNETDHAKDNLNVLNFIKKKPNMTVSIKVPNDKIEIKSDLPTPVNKKTTKGLLAHVHDHDEEIEEKLRQKQLSGDPKVIYAVISEYEKQREETYDKIVQNFPLFLRNSKGEVVCERMMEEIQDEVADMRRKNNIDELGIFKTRETFYDEDLKLLDIKSENLFKELAVIMNENQQEANQYFKMLQDDII